MSPSSEAPHCQLLQLQPGSTLGTVFINHSTWTRSSAVQVFLHIVCLMFDDYNSFTYWIYRLSNYKYYRYYKCLTSVLGRKKIHDGSTLCQNWAAIQRRFNWNYHVSLLTGIPRGYHGEGNPASLVHHQQLLPPCCLVGSIMRQGKYHTIIWFIKSHMCAPPPHICPPIPPHS